VVLALKNSMTG